MTTATKAGGAVLPVVGYMIQPAMASAYFHPKKEDPAYCLTCKPLTYSDDAQATIDELRAEVIALKSKQIDVEAVMRLADEWVVEAIHAALAANTGHATLADPDAAREALRASLLGDGGTL